MALKKTIWIVLFLSGLVIAAYLVARQYVSLPRPAWMARALGDSAVIEQLTLPPGYTISIFARNLGSPRLMQLRGDGSLYVSLPDEGRIGLVGADDDGDGESDKITTVAKGLRKPHGLWLDGDRLYVAEEHRVQVFKVAGDGSLSAPRTVLKGMPGGAGHSTRTIKKGPDGWFYVTVGSSCNVCVETHDWRAAMIRFKPGGKPEMFARGLRNTVGFDWQPGTGDLYGVDNGRDWLGDDFPPDELNLIRKDRHYGWPYFHGPNRPDPDLKPPRDAGLEPTPTAYDFAAHTAPLSIRFVRHSKDKTLAGAALVAQHGSWNRSTPIGYQIVALTWSAEGRITGKPFVTGFLRGDTVLGRPVDIVEAGDGTLFVSDDYAGVIYRITYRPPEP